MKKLLLLITLITTSLLQAVIPEMEVWSDGQGHYRYLLADYHVDYPDGRVSIAQQKDIVWATQQRQHEGVFVIAEDPHDPGYGCEKLKQLFVSWYDKDNTIHKLAQESLQEPNAKTQKYRLNFSPLLQLINACQREKIYCYNVECGQSLVQYKNHDNSTPEKISQKDIIEHLRTVMQKVAPNDSPLKDTLAKLTTINSPASFIDSGVSIRYKLLDLSAIYQLDECRAIKHGFVCTGLLHIAPIKSHLTKLGYTQLTSIGSDIHAEILHLNNTGNLETAFELVLSNALDLKKAFSTSDRYQVSDSIVQSRIAEASALC